MSEEKKPPRSLRDSGGPRYYRDWSAADEVIGGTDSAENNTTPATASPTEMHMVEGLDAFEPEPEKSAPALPGQEMAPLNVIVPEQAPASPPPKEPEKPKVTRIDRSKIQRARRYSEIKADEETQKQAEIEAQKKADEEAKKALTERTGKTQPLKKPVNQKTTELQSNIKEIGGTLGDAKESVKDTADALSQNIKELSEKFTETVVSGIQKFSKSINALLGRRNKKSPETDFNDEDIEDAPLQNTHVSKEQPKQANPLEQVPRVPPVWYADLLKEKVYFLTFDKQAMVNKPEEMSREDLQEAFIENAIQDIRKCIKLVRDLPDPKIGPYAGLPISYIFKNIRDQDIYFFMHYVLSKPDPFRKKTFKLSEAFATWILKRSDKTVVSEPFPEVPKISYFPLYKSNIRFQTLDRKQLVLASGKSAEEVDTLFMERAVEDIKNCVKLVEKFPSAQSGPYHDKPLKQIFRYVKPRDIYFFLHYIESQPDIFRGKNFKLAEAFASWILKRSHETKLP